MIPINLLDAFLFSGLISRRYAIESCVSAPPDVRIS